MRRKAQPDPLAVIANAPLFGGLTPSAQAACLAAARMRYFDKGAFLFHQDEPAAVFYVLLSGRARLAQINAEGDQVIIRFVGPGDGLGIIVALSHDTYPLSAAAVTDCQALSWDSAAIVALMEQWPRLAINGMELLAGRFRELQERYRELATERVERRLARAILRLAQQAGQPTGDGVLIEIPLTRQDLAELTGTTVYTVSRLCSRWEQHGVLSAGRERLAIRQLSELASIADDLPLVVPLANGKGPARD